MVEGGLSSTAVVRFIRLVPVVGMHGVLVVVERMAVSGFVGQSMHVRHAEHRRQRLGHALQWHTHDCERNQQSGQPGTVHVGEYVSAVRINTDNYQFGTFADARYFLAANDPADHSFGGAFAAGPRELELFRS